jgi:uncharacterized protein (DUF1810 family)
MMRFLVRGHRVRSPEARVWGPQRRPGLSRMMMGGMHEPSPADPFDLDRFVAAQEHAFADVRRELQAGRKTSHWMWFVFPQAEGLGWSAMAQRYALRSLAEARAYLDHPILGRRLLECVDLLLRIQGRSARDVLGEPDDLKLRSSMTLFALAAGEGSPFERVLEQYFAGEADGVTLGVVESWAGAGGDVRA